MSCVFMQVQVARAMRLRRSPSASCACGSEEVLLLVAPVLSCVILMLLSLCTNTVMCRTFLSPRKGGTRARAEHSWILRRSEKGRAFSSVRGRAREPSSHVPALSWASQCVVMGRLRTFHASRKSHTHNGRCSACSACNERCTCVQHTWHVVL